MPHTDVGGYGKDLPERSARPGLKSLRLGRKLLPGMVVTVEPGIYFNPTLLKPALSNPKQKKFLVKSVVQEYFSFGGASSVVAASKAYAGATEPDFQTPAWSKLASVMRPLSI